MPSLAQAQIDPMKQFLEDFILGVEDFNLNTRDKKEGKQVGLWGQVVQRRWNPKFWSFLPGLFVFLNQWVSIVKCINSSGSRNKIIWARESKGNLTCLFYSYDIPLQLGEWKKTFFSYLVCYSTMLFIWLSFDFVKKCETSANFKMSEYKSDGMPF